MRVWCKNGQTCTNGKAQRYSVSREISSSSSHMFQFCLEFSRWNVLMALPGVVLEALLVAINIPLAMNDYWLIWSLTKMSKFQFIIEFKKIIIQFFFCRVYPYSEIQVQTITYIKIILWLNPIILEFSNFLKELN